MASVNDLPNEILARILHAIVADQMNTESAFAKSRKMMPVLVCKKWFYICDNAWWTEAGKRINIVKQKFVETRAQVALFDGSFDDPQRLEIEWQSNQLAARMLNMRDIIQKAWDDCWWRGWPISNFVDGRQRYSRFNRYLETGEDDSGMFDITGSPSEIVLRDGVWEEEGSAGQLS